MTINLTVIIEEESLRNDLEKSSSSSLLVYYKDLKLLINPGSEPRKYINNFSKIAKDLDSIDFIIITCTIPRYWSSIKALIKKLSKIPKILIPYDNVRMYKLISYLQHVVPMHNVNIIKEVVQIDDLKIINIKSCTYGELVLKFNQSLISTPALWFINYIDNVLNFLKDVNIYVGGIPLPIVPVHRYYYSTLRSIWRKVRKIFLGHIHTQSVRKFLTQQPVEVRILRSGLSITI